ncbi:GntR family transcriptional regulator [Hoeflea prorocentri]|uniref:GntR family transcriptional regulator n=1 Tax=Hoeflea prorocentri TaxID=1922333 RepID=A0A9X3UIB3_9HYPH|nr:GntR family transcriptional regulator [Hoeflea prorocentri]MCY6381918.1 GntR family transcriptional regulator [Hoeflea prorocentri]MDA5399718.1 GntR family transcriptional regulator [Hoeflea prorocentri]
MDGLKSPLQQRVASQLVQFLREGGFAVGDRVNEGECSRVLGVSRTPVRSALHFLVDQRILERKRNKGFFVLKIPDTSYEIASKSFDEHEKLYNSVITDMLTQELPRAISTEKLLKRYGGPRAAITSIIRRLNREGLVQPAAGRGWSFIEVDAAALVKGFKLRLLIEPEMISLPEFEFNQAFFDQVYEEHLRLESAESLADEWPNIFEQDVQFHEALARCSGNQFIIEVIQRQNIIRRITEYVGFMGHQRVRESISEHIDIIEALKVDDREWAAAVLRRHLRRATEHYEAHLGNDIGRLASLRASTRTTRRDGLGIRATHNPISKTDDESSNGGEQEC